MDDVLTRRTHIAFEAPDRGRRAVERRGALMAPCLGWDEATRAHEMTHYRARLDAESAAQRMLDDAASAAARAPVQDMRLTRTDRAHGPTPTGRPPRAGTPTGHSRAPRSFGSIAGS